MILTCSACATRYLMDPVALGPNGRMVRCAKCGHSWMQTPPADMPRILDVPPPAPPGATAGRIMLPARIPPPRQRHGAGSLVLFVVVVGLVLGVVYFGRERIVAAWPQAEQLYELVGLRATAVGAGLELSNVTYVLRQIEGQNVMIIEGDIFNKTETPLLVPALRATLRNEHNQWLRDWTFKVGRPALQPGETAKFRTMTKDPPDSYRTLAITFTEDQAGG